MTPEEVALEYARLMKGGHFHDAVRLMTRDSLEQLRQEAEAHFKQLEPMTIESLMEEDPDLTWVEAQDIVSGLVDPEWSEPLFEPGLEGIPTLEALRKLTPPEVAARWLEATDLPAHHRKSIDGLIQLHPEFRTQLLEQRHQRDDGWDHVVLGSITRGDVAYVVWEQLNPEPGLFDELNRPSVVVLHATPEGWALAHDARPLIGAAHIFFHTFVVDEYGDRVDLVYPEPPHHVTGDWL